MKEDFLHFLWKFAQFEHKSLSTTEGEVIVIYKRGFLNDDSGPDFKEARLSIGDIEWAGNVEIHLRSSDWGRHGHQFDKAYNSVILHVVWDHDETVYNEQGKTIPTLQLVDFADNKLLNRYRGLLASMENIACQNQFQVISEIRKLTMLDRALMQRLQRKADEVLERLKKNLGDWEETAYQTVAMRFGFKLNNAGFLGLAKSIPFKLVKKYNMHEIQLEALLFGVSGLMKGADDKYAQGLKSEFAFLNKKHQLEKNIMEASQWKFLRTRPGNFPTIRIAQLLGFLRNRPSIFDWLLETEDFKTIIFCFQQDTSAYWHSHYAFGKQSASPMQGIGKASVENLIVNAVSPLLVAYGKYVGEPRFIDRAISFLEAIPAEKNRITRFWETQDLAVKNMADSQSCIELFNEFCQKKKCLDCGIGHGILNG